MPLKGAGKFFVVGSWDLRLSQESVFGDGGVETYTKAIPSALGSFGSGFAKDIGSVISSSIKEPVNEMRDQIKEGRLDNSN
jgi:hypothetical protein